MIFFNIKKKYIYIFKSESIIYRYGFAKYSAYLYLLNSKVFKFNFLLNFILIKFYFFEFGIFFNIKKKYLYKKIKKIFLFINIILFNIPFLS